jgi:hypothetical protein
MPTSANEDGRPTQGGAAQPVHIMNSALSGGGSGGGQLPGESAVVTSPLGANSAQTTGIITPASGGNVIVPTAGRKLWMLQNSSTNPLYVFLGAGANLTTQVSFILKGCAVADDGSGGFISDDLYKGTVSVAGTSPRCIAGQLI